MAASSECAQMTRNSRSLQILCHHSICIKCLSKHGKTYADAFPEGRSNFACPKCSSDESLPKDIYLCNFFLPEDKNGGMRNLLMWCEHCEDVAKYSCKKHELTKFPETIEKTEAEIKKIIEESYENLNMSEENSIDHDDEVAIDMNTSTLQEFFDKVKCLVEEKVYLISLDSNSGTTEKINKLNRELKHLEVRLQEKTKCSNRISCRFCTDGEDLILLKHEKLTDILCFLKKLNSFEYDP